MPWYDTNSFLVRRKDALAALASMVQMVGFTVAAGALVVALFQLSTANSQLAIATSQLGTAMEQLQLARQALQASTVWQAQREGRDVLGAIQASEIAPCIFDAARWDRPPCVEKDAVKKRDAQLIKLIQYYASVSRQRGAFGSEAWQAFRLEICQHLRDSRPIQIFWNDTVKSGAYSDEFKELPQSCGIK